MFPSLRHFLNSEKSRISARESVTIGIVVAILISVIYQIYRGFDAARENSRRAMCASNLKQIGVAIGQYTQDYNDTLPRAWFGKDAGASDAKTNYKWMDAILPYVKKEEFFNCPSDSVGKPYRYRSGINYGSYVFNNAYFAPGDKFTPPSGINGSAMPSNALAAASNPVVVADGESDFQIAWPDVKSSPQIDASAINELHKLGTMTQRHLGTANRLFFDGRVSSYSLRQDAAPKTINGQQIFTGLTIEGD